MKHLHISPTTKITGKSLLQFVHQLWQQEIGYRMHKGHRINFINNQPEQTEALASTHEE